MSAPSRSARTHTTRPPLRAGSATSPTAASTRTRAPSIRTFRSTSTPASRFRARWAGPVSTSASATCSTGLHRTSTAPPSPTRTPPPTTIWGVTCTAACNTASKASRILGEAVAEPGGPALGGDAAEGRRGRPGAEALGAQRVAGEDRRRETHVQAPQPRRVVAAEQPQDRAPGDAVGAEAVQDRLRVAGFVRDRGQAVHRVVVPRQPVQQPPPAPRGQPDPNAARAARLHPTPPP